MAWPVAYGGYLVVRQARQPGRELAAPHPLSPSAEATCVAEAPLAGHHVRTALETTQAATGGPTVSAVGAGNWPQSRRAGSLIRLSPASGRGRLGHFSMLPSRR